MKKWSLIFIFAAFVMLYLGKPALAQSTPIQIYTCQDLQNINNNLAGNYVLANDIDCSATNPADPNNATSIWNAGYGFIPIGSTGNACSGVTTKNFTGVLDGANHQINNLQIIRGGACSASDQTPLGVFSSALGATLKNIVINNAVITGGYQSPIGILAGQLNNSFVQNVRTQGTITAGGGARSAPAGGITALLSNNSQIIQSSANINITTGGYAGGLAAQISGGTIDQSYAQGIITANNTYFATGGLVGSVQSANNSISDSYSKVQIIFYWTSVPVYNTPRVGGLIGTFLDSDSGDSITDSFAAGSISAPYLSYTSGGLIGTVAQPPTITNSYWDTQATGQTSSASSPSSNGKTTAQMLQQNTYQNWDFNSIWTTDGAHYPILVWQEQNQINLWNTFNALNPAQITTFENNSPPNTINWSTLGYISNSINWIDIQVLTKPPVWPYQQTITTSGYLNSINWNYLGALGNAYINWADILVFSRSAINWASVNPLIHSGVNWLDWQISTTAGVNWNAVAMLSRVEINWNNIGTLPYNSVNWTNLASITKQGINWYAISSLSNSNANWNDYATLNEIPISFQTLETLRTIGVSPIVQGPAAPTTAQLILNLTGNGTGTFTSSPSGINCASGSSTGCTATFALNQPVTLNFTSINNSAVTNWGGCTPVSATSCTATPDQNLVISIAINTISYTITASAGTGGTISPSGAVSVPYGGSQTFTMTALHGYGISQYTVTNPATGNSLTGNSFTIHATGSVVTSTTYTFNNVTTNDAIAVSFVPVKSLNIQTTGSGGGSIYGFDAFGKVLPCLSSTAGNTISCSGSYVTGTSVTLIVSPNGFSSFKRWIGIPGCSTQSTCTFTINRNISAEAVFALKPVHYTITASAGTGGTISPSGSVSVLKGNVQGFLVLAKRGYKLNQVLVDNKPVRLLLGSIYIFTDVTATHTITASFDPAPIASSPDPRPRSTSPEPTPRPTS